jgi:hypothetical protein
VNVQDEGIAVTGNPHAALNFVGAGVTATDAGGGVSTVTVPGSVSVQNQSVNLSNNPHRILNFNGDGVIAFDAGGGVASIVIPVTAAQSWGALDVDAGANTRFLAPGLIATATATDVLGVPVSFNTTLKNFFVRHNIAAGNGNSVVYTVLLNGVATTLTVTLATGAVTSDSDTTNQVPVSAGDVLSIRASKTVAIGSGVVNAFASLLFES